MDALLSARSENLRWEKQVPVCMCICVSWKMLKESDVNLVGIAIQKPPIRLSSWNDVLSFLYWLLEIRDPASYFRLVPPRSTYSIVGRSESFSFSSCSARLGRKTDMCALANPFGTCQPLWYRQKQTVVEMRSPDGSADLYQLLAGLAVACRFWDRWCFWKSFAEDLCKREYS